MPGVPQENEKGAESRPVNSQHAVSSGELDDTTVFYNLHKDKVEPLTPEIEASIVRKNFWFLLAQTWWIAFCIHLDKSTLSQASTMGIFKDVNMTKGEYNDLFVVFYTGYLIALWPGAVVSQRVGQKHFITASLFLWALLLGMHPLVKTGKQLIGLRFLLGMVSYALIEFALEPALMPSNYRRNLRLCPALRWCTRLSFLHGRVHGCSYCGGLLGALQTFS